MHNFFLLKTFLDICLSITPNFIEIVQAVEEELRNEHHTDIWLLVYRYLFEIYIFFKNTLIFQISAQESRRKKKEYMDCLERRMQSLIEELEAYKHRFTNLEGQNISLRSQVQQLQAQVSQCNCTNK